MWTAPIPGLEATAAGLGGGVPSVLGKLKERKNPSCPQRSTLCFPPVPWVLTWGHGSAPASFLHINHFL